MTPSPNILTYDRGTQAFILQGVGAANPQTGTGLPPGSTAYALPAAVSHEQTPPTYTFQVDVASGTPISYQFTAYGSLDGVNWYSLGTIGSAGTAGLTAFVDKKVRFLTAALTTAATGGTVSCSFAA